MPIDVRWNGNVALAANEPIQLIAAARHAIISIALWPSSATVWVSLAALRSKSDDAEYTHGHQSDHSGALEPHLQHSEYAEKDG